MKQRIIDRRKERIKERRAIRGKGKNKRIAK